MSVLTQSYWDAMSDAEQYRAHVRDLIGSADLDPVSRIERDGWAAVRFALEGHEASAGLMAREAFRGAMDLVPSLREPDFSDFAWEGK